MALAGIKEVSHLELQTHPVVQETFVKVEVHIPTVLQIFRIIYLAFRLIVCIGIYPKAISELHRVSPRKNSPRIVERFYSSWGIYLAIISLYLHTPTRAPLSDDRRKRQRCTQSIVRSYMFACQQADGRILFRISTDITGVIVLVMIVTERKRHPSIDCVQRKRLNGRGLKQRIPRFVGIAVGIGNVASQVPIARSLDACPISQLHLYISQREGYGKRREYVVVLPALFFYLLTIFIIVGNDMLIADSGLCLHLAETTGILSKDRNSVVCDFTVVIVQDTFQVLISIDALSIGVFATERKLSACQRMR